MRLRGLEVWHWRGLEHVVLDDLAPDVTLITGPNEAGKSRLFEALEHALFERYKGGGEERKALQGWGSAEAPRVAVRFELDGVVWRVEKRFLKSPYATLEGGGVTLKDDDAEDKLRALLGTREPEGRTGPARMKSRGVWPLLWLRQGEARLVPHEHLTDTGRSRLVEVLAAQIGEVTAGPQGERVLARAQEEAERYWATKVWRPKAGGPLAAAQAELDAATRELADAERRRAEAHDTADRVDRARAELAGLGDRLDARRAALAEARARLSAAEQLKREIDEHERRRDQLDALVEAARDAAAERRRLDDEHTRVAAALARAAGELNAAERRCAELEAQVADAQRQVVAAEAAEAAAAANRRRAAAQRARAEAAAAVARANERLEAARAVAAELADVERALAAVRIDAKALKALRDAERDAAAARARVEGAAARLTIRATAPLQVDGALVLAGGVVERQATEKVRVVLDRVAEIEVEPGGEGLGKLLDARRDAEAAVARRLAALGCASLDEAQAAADQRAALEGRLAPLRRALAERAPQGVSAIEAEAQRAAAALAALGDDDPDAPAPEGAERDEQAARAALDAARTARDALRERLGAARVDEATRREEQKGLSAQEARLRERVAAAPPAADLDAALAARLRDRDDAALVARTAREAWVAGGGDRAADAVAQATQALESVERQRADLDKRRIEGEAVLRSLQGERLHEACEEAASRVAAARAELSRVTSRAEAARRLLLALEAARSDSRRRLVAPVLERVAPWLREVFPGSSLDLDDDWNVLGLRTGDRAEGFDYLSGGAQEQLSVLVRLALAEVLGEGRPLPLVLDDALVNTDAARREAMLRVLYQAGRKLQIVVFSCHDVAFDGLGEGRRFVLDARPRQPALAGVGGRGD